MLNVAFRLCQKPRAMRGTFEESTTSWRNLRQSNALQVRNTLKALEAGRFQAVSDTSSHASSQCNAGALPIFQDLNTAWRRYLKKRLPRLFANTRKPSNQPTNPPTNQLFRNSPRALQIGVLQTYSDTLLQHARLYTNKSWPQRGAWSNKSALLWSTDKGRQKVEPLYSCEVWQPPWSRQSLINWHGPARALLLCGFRLFQTGCGSHA